MQLRVHVYLLAFRFTGIAFVGMVDIRTATHCPHPIIIFLLFHMKHAGKYCFNITYIYRVQYNHTMVRVRYSN